MSKNGKSKASSGKKNPDKFRRVQCQGCLPLGRGNVSWNNHWQHEAACHNGESQVWLEVSDESSAPAQPSTSHLNGDEEIDAAPTSTQSSNYGYEGLKPIDFNEPKKIECPQDLKEIGFEHWTTSLVGFLGHSGKLLILFLISIVIFCEL